MSYPGSKASKRICKSATVQNAEHTADFNVRRERRVVHVPGLEGRILSRPHVPSPQTFSEVCIPRTGLPVQGAALWPVSLAKSFYKGGGSGPVPPSSSRLEDPALLGRLANLCPRSCPSHERHRESNLSRTELRAQDESGEEQPHPHTEYNVCGATIKFSHNAWLAYPTEGVQAPSAGEPVPSWQTIGVGAVSEVAGHNVSLLRVRPLQRWLNASNLHPRVKLKVTRHSGTHYVPGETRPSYLRGPHWGISHPAGRL